ncbi:MAG TPA: tRNA pseudouridine(55) synthase TruB [Saprospiraceae bacterium]|nr:tRNA pseudouridine(55) synthase TruB [Saprospiraceae bacterium]
MENINKTKINTAALRFFNERTELTRELIEEGLVFLIDKPLHWTSFDVVNKLRYALRGKFGIKKLKVGHAGTLDPLADGLIIVCCGKYTKIIDNLLNEHKSYTAIIKLGAVTATYDAEAAEENILKTDHLTVEDVNKALEDFKGKIQQVPPIYSAIKISGKSAYELARRGKDVILSPRTVEILNLEVISFDNPYLTLITEVSKGTYIRSLAHDIGSALNVGGYLVKLRRESIGCFKVDQGFHLERVLSLIGN